MICILLHQKYHFIYLQITCLFYSIKNLKTLETNLNVALDNISNWLKANKLTLNVTKSHLLIFNINKNNGNNKMQIKLFIDKEELEQKILSNTQVQS